MKNLANTNLVMKASGVITENNNYLEERKKIIKRYQKPKRKIVMTYLMGSFVSLSLVLYGPKYAEKNFRNFSVETEVNLEKLSETETEGRNDILYTLSSLAGGAILFLGNWYVTRAFAERNSLLRNQELRDLDVKYFDRSYP